MQVVPWLPSAGRNLQSYWTTRARACIPLLSRGTPAVVLLGERQLAASFETDIASLSFIDVQGVRWRGGLDH